jgi:hypothetical protein
MILLELTDIWTINLQTNDYRQIIAEVLTCTCVRSPPRGKMQIAIPATAYERTALAFHCVNRN